MPWATVLTYKRDKDKGFLRRCYDRYIKQEQFLLEQRYYEGMFFYSSQVDVEKDNYLLARYESGWDNSPRWDAPVINYWPIDLNCFMVMFYRAMAEMAMELGEGGHTVALWREKEAALTRLIEERLYNEQLGCYVDVDRFSGEQSRILSPACFMPLYIGIATKERAESMNRIAAHKGKFFPGMPTVAYDDPTFSRDYWRGPTWMNVAYFAAKGLRDYGFDDTADGIREFILQMVYDNREGGIFETYDSVSRQGQNWHNFSWSCAFVIEFILNW